MSRRLPMLAGRRSPRRIADDEIVRPMSQSYAAASGSTGAATVSPSERAIRAATDES
jgi:hypothetical protein